MSAPPRVWARTPDLGRGPLIQDCVVTLVERHNRPDTWTLTGPKAELAPIMSPRFGTCLIDEDGRVISGRVVRWERSWEQVATVACQADTGVAWQRIAYPVPTATFQGGQSAAHDRRTGPRETVALDYLRVNAGQSALTPRRVAGLTVPTGSGRGGTVTKSARFDALGALVSDLLEPAGLRWRIVQTSVDSPTLTVEVTVPGSVPPEMSLGIPGHGGPSLLTEWSYEVAEPDASVALLGAAGDLASRITRERVGSQEWGRIEAFVDQRQTDDLAEIDKAGDDVLADAVAVTTIDARIESRLPVGALVTVSLDGVQITERVRTLTTTWHPDQVTYQASIGSTTDTGLTIQQRQLLDLSRRIRKVAAS